ncbi:MAG: SIMPL domain-containing protein, partial [Acidimicrobiales bacterium]
MDGRVLVRGRGEVRAAPDVARLSALVTADRKTADEAHAAASSTSREVDAVFDRHAEALRRSATGALLITRRTQWHDGQQRHVGWRASRSTELE